MGERKAVTKQIAARYRRADRPYRVCWTENRTVKNKARTWVSQATTPLRGHLDIRQQETGVPERVA